MNDGNVKDKPLVLLIEDEDVVATMTTAMLEALGCAVTHCATGAEARDVYTNMHEEIGLVILDMVLPDSTGTEIYKDLVTINSKVKCLVASGYSQDETIQDLIDIGANGFIQKPFKLAQLSEKINQLLPQ